MENNVKAIGELQERISLISREYKGLASEYQTALQTAVLALQKQVPQKPRSGRNKSRSCKCGLIVQTGSKRSCLHYCHNCGQAIDWE